MVRRAFEKKKNQVSFLLLWGFVPILLFMN